jgi:phage terminase large subunit GpA-like protein
MTTAAVERLQLPAVTRAAIARAVQLGLDSLRALPPMSLSEWAGKHFRLAGDSSHQRGGWEAWPFQVGMLDFMSDDDIYELDVFKSKRVGYTKCLAASIGYDAAHRRRNQALWQPTDDDRDSFVKSEVDPMIEGVPVVRAARRLTKGVEDTIKYKQFRDSVLHLLGGKAARAYRRITVASAKLDELDGFDQQIEKSSDPFTLAEGRLEGAPFPKIICGSTPRLKGMSHIEHRAQLADAFMRYHITCPHCGVEHPLIWGGKDSAHGFKWEPGRPDTVRHVCPHCLASITQADYLANWVGAWVCDRTGLRYGADKTWRTAAGQPAQAPRHVAVHVWAAYSPQREWVDIARQCIAAAKKLAAGDTGPMQGFTNETLAQTWELAGERTEEHQLQARAEPYPLRTVPVGALRLTAGIDVQGNRWEINVWGWGRGMESWIVDDIVIEGNPADERDWDDVAAHLDRRYPMAWNGATMGIDATSVDSGHHTHAVYHFVRQQQARRRIHAIKGSSDEGKPIKGTASPVEITWRGQRWPNGIKLWVIGVDTAKDLLHGQLAIAQPGPGYVHFSQDLPREWFEQLTAEQRIPVRSQGGEIMRWVKRRPRNEKLDCRNYATHAAHMLGLNALSDAAWARLEAVVQPPPDLFTPAPPAVQPPTTSAPAVAVRAPAPVRAAPPPHQVLARDSARAW